MFTVKKFNAVNDFRMLEAIQNCQKVITLVARALSGKPIDTGKATVSEVDEIYTFDRLPTKKVFGEIGR